MVVHSVRAGDNWWERLESTPDHQLLIEVSNGEWKEADPRTRATLTVRLMKYLKVDTSKQTGTTANAWLSEWETRRLRPDKEAHFKAAKLVDPQVLQTYGLTMQVGMLEIAEMERFAGTGLEHTYKTHFPGLDGNVWEFELRKKRA
jgi:hypothetical protein